MLSFFHSKVYFFPERLLLYLEARLQKHRWFVFTLSAAYNKNRLEDLYQAGCGFLMCILYQASKKQTSDKNQFLRTVMQESQPQPLAIPNTHKLSLICGTSQYVGWVLRAWQGLMESLGSATASETGESLMLLARWIWLFSELPCFCQPVPLPSHLCSVYGVIRVLMPGSRWCAYDWRASKLPTLLALPCSPVQMCSLCVQVT